MTIMATRKRWSDLNGAQRTAIIVGSAIEVVLTCVALADLARRPRAQVRGPKALPTLLLGVARPDLSWGPRRGTTPA